MEESVELDGKERDDCDVRSMAIRGGDGVFTLSKGIGNGRDGSGMW